MNTRHVFSMLAVASFAFAAHTAVANTPSMHNSTVEVRYDDLNLANATGTETVQRRIKQAADRACGGRDSRDLRRAMVYEQCTSDATTKALAQINRQKSSRS